MLVIGLTGGIGSGKSTVAKLFEEFNIPVYYSDIEAKKLMINSKIIKRRLISYFGEEVYVNGQLNRPFLANLIFTNKTNLEYVNSVVHPKVNQHFKRWIKKQNKNNYSFVLQENAILFENGSNDLFDKIIVVTAPIEVRIGRVMKRDKTSKAKVLERINNQWSDEKKIAKSDFVIENIDIDNTKKQVKNIYNLLIK